jgi:hypothetical protein
MRYQCTPTHDECVGRIREQCRGLAITHDPEAVTVSALANEVGYIRTGYLIGLKSCKLASSWQGAQDKDTVGKNAEEALCQHLSSKLPSFSKGPNPGAPPDAVNRGHAYEIKTYCGSPGFDIGNFGAFVTQAATIGGVKRLLETLYIVVAYNWDACTGTAEFSSVQLLPVWALVSYTGIRPLSVQSKRGTWYNLRPSAASGWHDADRTPGRFIEALCKAVDQCPNMGICDKRDTLKQSIGTQFAEIMGGQQE